MPDIEEPLERCCKFIETISDASETDIKQHESSQIKHNIKTIYDYSKQEEQKCSSFDALQKLIIQNLDNEQIWQQLELQNNIVLKNVHKKLGNLLSIQENQEDENDQLSEHDESDEQSQSDVEDEDVNSDESRNDDDSINDDESISDSDLDKELLEDDSNDEKILDREENTSKNKLYEKTAVDDEFFRLREMEDFLVSEEKKIDENPREQQEDSEEEEEDDIDYFDEEALNESEGEDDARMAKFKDFFVSKEEKNPKKNKFLDELSEDEENLPSNFELRQDRLQKRIEAIENNAVAEKPWTLKGEIKADSRPINSLLEEDVEFDRTGRPAPIVTGQTTVLLEDIIMQRIRDRAFDSVERKLKVVDTPYEYKKKLLIDQEKSKKSLAQIYENEYLEQKAALDPDYEKKEEEEPALHKEIKTMMTTLFDQLDALSNYHYTPKPAIPEVKIISNIPALNLEEVGPVIFSDATLLAPAEVKAKTRGDILDKSERTSTDKKRERRKKKSKQRYHAQLKEKKEKEKEKSGKGKVTKDKADQLLKTLTKDSGIKKMIQSSNSIKSSSAFFTQLEDKKKMNSDTAKNGNKRKKNGDTSTFNAKKLKL